MPEPDRKQHVWSTPDRISALTRTPFGEALMQRVAERLQTTGKGLRFCHPEYCGHGLFFANGKFELVEVQDGDPRKTLLSWNTAEAFVAFWSKQSDYSCSGADAASTDFFTENSFDLNNQRITRERLEKYAQD